MFGLSLPGRRMGKPAGPLGRGLVFRPWPSPNPPATFATDKLFIGADVAQEWIDTAIAGQPGRAMRIANTTEAINAWIAVQPPGKVGIVAFEATGGLERPLDAALIDARLS